MSVSPPLPAASPPVTACPQSPSRSLSREASMLKPFTENRCVVFQMLIIGSQKRTLYTQAEFYGGHDEAYIVGSPMAREAVSTDSVKEEGTWVVCEGCVKKTDKREMERERGKKTVMMIMTKTRKVKTKTTTTTKKAKDNHNEH